jgi:beta-lactamase regulating signal transducer with metallopeptidase domain
MLLIYQYILKFSISIAIVYLFYHFLLRRLTFYNSNRWYLLLYSLSSFLIPVINIASLVDTGNISRTQFVHYIAALPSSDKVNLEVIRHPATYPMLKQLGEWTLLILALGVIVMLVRLALQYFSFLKVKQNSTLLFKSKVSVFQVDKPIIPFSIGNSIFINQNLHNEEELKEIIRHEFIHVKQKHSIDTLVSETICVLNWYNPFAWMMRRAIRNNLEFIADSKVLEAGLDKKEYQRLLLKVIGISQFSLSTKFNFSSLKKRIAMMNKKQSAKAQLFRMLLLLPVMTIILLAFRTVRNEAPWQSGKRVSVYTSDTIPAANDTAPKPPPPPRPPVPPPPPPPPALPKDVKSINITEKKATVTLKNGNIEKYDLANRSEREAYQKKYGDTINRNRDEQRKSMEMMMIDMKRQQEQAIESRMEMMKSRQIEQDQRMAEFEHMQKQKQEELELLQSQLEMDASRNDEMRKLQYEKALKDKRANAQQSDILMRQRELLRAKTEKETELAMLQNKLSMEADIKEHLRGDQLQEKMEMENYLNELQKKNIELQNNIELNSKNIPPQNSGQAIKQLEMQQKQLSQVMADLKQQQERIDKQIEALKRNKKKAD